MNEYKTYYPRPLLRRNSFYSLDGKWLLNNQEIEIPFPIESKLSGYQGKLDKIEYQKEFSLPHDFSKPNDKVILNILAIDQIADVYLNDVFLIHHEGGYLPFKVDITNILKENNILKIKVIDNLDLNYPYGKQTKKPKGMWYTQVSGIWQSVFIESYDKDGIDDLQIETTKNQLKLHLESNSEYFKIEFDGFENEYYSKDITIDIKEGHLWSLEDPFLYHLKISTINDSINSYFALREITVKEINNHKRILLNDQPIFINGLLDQGYYEEGLFIPKDPKDYYLDIKNIKELGYNCLRKHLKVEADIFYYYCDQVGILVMQDMVNLGSYNFFFDTALPTIGLKKMYKPILNRRRYQFFIKHSKETIKHLKSHPSIFAYTIYNEGWGQQGANRAYEELKKEDPSRLFDTTSGWFCEQKSDFNSEHIYFKNKVLNSKDKILALTECGGFIRPIEGHYDETLKTWGYGTSESEEELTDLIINMHKKMVIPSIKNGLALVIMTQLNDVENEVNGLYTYDHKILKVNKNRLIEANKRLQEVYLNSLYKQ